MPLTMIRRPRSANAAKKIVKDEVRQEWDAIAQEVITQLNEFVADWANKPVFKSSVTLGAHEWKFIVRWDRRTKAGKIFHWVDAGTPPHVITAKKAKMLRFGVPDYPKTLPSNGGMPVYGQSTDGDQDEVMRKSVNHPGIAPRGFIEYIVRMLRVTGSGGFRNRTDAAMKRGIRRLNTE